MENIMQFFKPMEKGLELYREFYSKMQGSDELGMFKPMEQGIEMYKQFLSGMGGMEEFSKFMQPMEKTFESVRAACGRMDGFQDMKKCFMPFEKGLETFHEYMQKLQADGELFQSPYRDFYSNFITVYEETVGKFFKVPAVGPAREAFEKYLKSVDTSIKFYGAALDFYFKLQKPWMESIDETAEKAGKILAENPEDLDTFKEFYDLLIKTYEERFQELFKTEAFGLTMQNMLAKSLEFQQAYEEMAEEFLKYTPVATKSDMNDVYVELYNLKKRVREQAKNHKKA